VAVALIGCGLIYLVGSTPWVVGKTLAISSPALLAAALTGAGMLWGRHRAGIILVAVLAGGVLWSNALAYHDVTLAPRPALEELQHIGELLKGKGPTFVNDYEIYADRHFLREGAPVEPGEYRSVSLPLNDGVALAKNAWADLDSFGLSTLEPYRSIVLRRSPAESRPPSIYKLVYRGSYYELWQRPAQPTTIILQHVPFGESNTLPYCGPAEDAKPGPLCSVDPVAVPACKQILELGSLAQRQHAQLVAYERPAPIVARGDQTVWPARWIHNPEGHTLTPTAPGKAVTHIALDSDQIYELWLSGSFGRGFEVSVDGHHVGTVKNELSSTDGYVHLANLKLSSGVHTFVLSYPHADLGPGSGLGDFSTIDALSIQPLQSPASKLIRLAPSQAQQLCGLSLDWLELVSG
jgi:hypothetical protein